MVRTQVQLPDNEYRRLREVSHRQKRSMADCIREGIDLFLGKGAGEADDFSDIAGKFRPLPGGEASGQARWAEAILASKRRGRR